MDRDENAYEQDVDAIVDTLKRHLNAVVEVLRRVQRYLDTHPDDQDPIEWLGVFVGDCDEEVAATVAHLRRMATRVTNTLPLDDDPHRWTATSPESLAIPRTGTRQVRDLVRAMREDKTSSEPARTEFVLGIAERWNVGDPRQRAWIIEEVARAARVRSMRALRER